MRLLLLALLMTSCGKQEHQVKVDDSNHSLSGEAYTYMVVRFDFITDIKKLCSGLHPLKDFEDKIERNRAVSQCTFDNLSVLDSIKVEDFKADFCEHDDAYNELPVEDKLRVDQLCDAL